MKSLQNKFSLLVFALLTIAITTAQASPCEKTTAHIEVDTTAHRLFLCQNGQVREEHKVALGRGGLDKKKEGDAKTPLGVYQLGEPYGSKRFFVFIPVGYPTDVQRRAGQTGSDIGVHGPLIYLSWLGFLNTWIDWTNGCIAVGSKAEVQEISQWVLDQHVTEIDLY